MALEIVYVNVSDLRESEYNPRRFPKEAKDKLKESIKKFGFVDPLIVNSNPERRNVVIGGHFRLLVAKELGIKEVPVVYVNVDKEKEKELSLRLNRNTGEWDWKLLRMFESDFLKRIGFSDRDLEKIFTKTRKVLSKDFIVPPLSVLDARKQTWISRMVEWEELGFDGTKGRPTKLLGISKQVGGGEGTSKFDPVLAEVCYKWFNTENGIILDPFSGGVTRGFVAGYLGYEYWGVDISEEQIKANLEQVEELQQLLKVKPNYTVGDSYEIDKLIQKREFDLIFTCPPYFDLECYTDNPNDLSNMSWDRFKERYKEIIKKSCDLLAENRFAIFVISEVRDRNGVYRGLVELTKEAFKEAGLKFYNDIIYLNAVGNAAVRARKQMKTRKVVKVHQNVLVFYKGDTERISEFFSEIKTESDEEDY
jgi:ParB/RepB/Spo0J family partition protein